MLVDKDTLAVLPKSDEVLKALAGEYVNETELDGLGLSNELALHVIELKTMEPPANLIGLDEQMHKACRKINKILDEFNGRLMPTAMHPFMNPHEEMKLWPHENSPIY